MKRGRPVGSATRVKVKLQDIPADDRRLICKLADEKERLKAELALAESVYQETKARITRELNLLTHDLIAEKFDISKCQVRMIVNRGAI